MEASAVLGQGGMGAVYRVRNLLSQRLPLPNIAELCTAVRSAQIGTILGGGEREHGLRQENFVAIFERCQQGLHLHIGLVM